MTSRLVFFDINYFIIDSSNLHLLFIGLPLVCVVLRDKCARFWLTVRQSRLVFD